MELIPLTNISVWFIAKIFVIIAMIIYIVFALVVVKQVNLMTDTLEVELEGLLKLIAIAHLGFAIFVVLAAIILL